MGFGVSGATAVVFLAVLVAGSVAFSAFTVASETVTEANAADSERLLDQRNTAIQFVGATNDTTAGELTVDVENTGSIELTVSGTDLLVDNRAATSTTVTLFSGTGTVVDSGDPATLSTDAWLPGETLRFTVSGVSDPQRVTVVAPRGVRISGTVSDLEAL
jgi:flagellar protein FlaF